MDPPVVHDRYYQGCFFCASKKKGKPLYNSTRLFFAQEDPNGPKMFTIYFFDLSSIKIDR